MRMQGRIGDTHIVTDAARPYMRHAAYAAAIALAGAATAACDPGPPPPEYAGICVKDGTRVDESQCPQGMTYDDDTEEIVDGPDYYGTPAPGGASYFFIPANGGYVPAVGQNVRGVGGTYTKPPTGAYINPRGPVAAKGGTITRGGFGISNSSYGGSSGS